MFVCQGPGKTLTGRTILELSIAFLSHKLNTFKGTTLAYKRMENGVFWSEIVSGFKEPVAPCTRLSLSNIWFDTHARINSMKTLYSAYFSSLQRAYIISF